MPRGFAAVLRRPVLALTVLALAGLPAAAGDFILRSDPRTYRIAVEYSVAIPGAKPGEIVVDFPLPVSDQYQDIVKWDRPDGEVRHYPGTGDPYLHVNLLRRHSRKNDPYETGHAFEAVLYAIDTDFDQARDPHPYLVNSPLFKYYTAARGEYIVPRHPEIGKIADSLGKTAKNDIDFARLALEHVARRFTLAPPAKKLMPLAKTLDTGAGDAAALNAVYVSLMRRRGIPARHLVGMAPDGVGNVFAEFYLEHRGWVPVDLVRRIGDPDGDYFGKIRAADAVVIMSRDIMHTVRGTSGDDEIVDLMQTYVYWADLKWNVIDGKYVLRNPGKPRHVFSFAAKK